MTINERTILVTGAAGFIGAALVQELLLNADRVIGIDNLNDYYDPLLKRRRLKEIENINLNSNGSWNFYEIGIENKDEMINIFSRESPEIVINLAAQAGVRYSIENPNAYIQSNLLGFANVLECCRHNDIKNFIYASSSSVYGGNKKLPFNEHSSVDHPISLYAATKKSNELIAHSYSHLYGIPSTGLRFFTVYGPWGRPDMAPIIFAKSIVDKKPIKVFNYGFMERDFTYINDVVKGIISCSYKPATINEDFNFLSPDPATSFAPHRVFNIGNKSPIKLLKFIELIEENLGINAIKDLQPLQQGDVISTCAEMNELEQWIGYLPSTSIEDGIKYFIDWFLDYY
tara:strand:+ start:87894 stop:88925 length:1032 start_codon:yes stop_codon:yes gene_type:complete